MRNITFVGSAKLRNNAVGYSLDSTEPWFRNALNAEGWVVHNLDFTIQSYANFWDSPFSIYISANVPDQYSNQDHLNLLSRVFTAYHWNYGITTFYPMTDVVLRVQGDNSQTGGGGNTGTPYRTQPITEQVGEAVRAGGNEVEKTISANFSVILLGVALVILIKR